MELRDSAARVKRVAAIGGGFIGMEVAAVLAQKGVDLTMILSDDRSGNGSSNRRWIAIASSARSILATNATPLEVTVTV
jgi:NADPH-dependent 2,4-dienoyl-CoA reductase/sulfur reductase-like enzyme